MRKLNRFSLLALLALALLSFFTACTQKPKSKSEIDFQITRKAAERGDAEAQFHLGMKYCDGDRDIQKDEVEAVKWFRKAADQGNAEGQCSIGGMYFEGKGVAKDYTESIKWFRKAADQGNVEAQLMLGHIYYEGKCAEKDYTESIKWFRKAADRGYAQAQFLLGHMYCDGNGIAKDYVEAYAYVNLSAASIKNAAKYRDDLEKEMTPQQIAEAQTRSKQIQAQIKP